ncbi:erythromycin esterase family protein [Streptomyces sp. UNOB3_S3]|uniref:erythromycin esterase family protein n=1 Tax=Streptomyces sp. UNOB3_S3 TaxID=2871682 RepID=UPI001E5CF08B|nr:erythromycin esterase family protein [Streptomyces sp. UNOB3_S3]MCC3773857.1 erythromycin esterase family protein [Streptomyces sp. UNOB3_S3]
MTAPTQGVVRPFTGDALTALLSSAPRLLGLGEPTHGVEAFPELRNELFRHLVEHEGYRSIALESDCLSALIADAYVTHGTGTLDDALDRGLSHGFGASAANRELLRWMRAHNERRPAHERLRFYGFDGPLEMTGAASPGPALTALHDYLAAHLDLPWSRESLTGLLGPDERWACPDALMDAARSVGRTPEAGRLRLIADDLRAMLTSHAPHLTAVTSPDDFWHAGLRARTATGLLRYHAGLADTAPTRLGTIMALRATMMADNLDAVVRREARRGPTLAFAHNGHLQRDKSRVRFAGLPLEWWSAGAVMSTRLGDDYAFAASTFGTRGSDVPHPGSLEGMLSALPHARAVIDPGRLTEALGETPARRVPADHTYAPLDPDTTDRIDAIVFVREI